METIQGYMYIMRVHDEGTVAANIKVTFRFTIALRLPGWLSSDLLV